MNFVLPADNKTSRNLISILETFSMDNNKEFSTPVQDQYALWQIIGIWLVGGSPMWILGWLVYPAMSLGLPPVETALLHFKLLTVGLIWQFVLAMIILYYEEGNIRLGTISRRFWLNHPVSARTGETRKSIWWWIIPLIFLLAFMEMGLRSPLSNLWITVFPSFAGPKDYDMSAMFTPEIRAQMVGDWSLFWLFVVMALFNTFLGEEFLFRGVLLPKMEVVFGKWDWLANGVIFGFYHLHQPWSIPSDVLAGWVFAFTGKRFHSNWFPIILHSVQSVYLLFLFLGLVLGLA